MVSSKLIFTLDKLPSELQEEILHYAEYLATKYTSTQSKDTPQIYRKAGSMKGTFSMTEDFDEPLDDLKAYMES
ncbi:MAG: DUF2281 domain-containing protein [Cyanobacteria bacterium P01_D01_bin.36]